MKKILTLTALAAILTLAANSAWASGGPFPTYITDGTFGGPVGTPTPNSNTGEFEIYNAVNLLLGSSYTNNAQIDPLEYTGNGSTWTQTNPGGYAFIGLGAGATNTLEVYNAATPGTLINPLGGGFSGNGNFGSGTIGSPFYGTGNVISIGDNFGFAINQSYGGSTNWYGDPTLNIDGMDHMLVYNLSQLAGQTIYVVDPNNSFQEFAVQLQNPYLLAFEDLPEYNSTNGSPSDIDYNDYIALVDGIAPLTGGGSPVPEPKTWALFAVGLIGIAGIALRRKFAFVK